MSDNSDPEEIRIFVKEDKKPVQFYLHASLTSQQQHELARRIETHGGEICDNEEDADTILVNYEHYDLVYKRYSHSQTIYVERPDFVRRCLNRRMYEHDKVLKRSLGGIPPGRPRREYTNYDDDCLAEYIARRIPDPNAGARTGNGIYIQLCDPTHEQEYPWAKNHTWQSWRNRFRKNQERIVAKIDEYLRKNPPHPEGKGEYAYDRRNFGLGKRNRSLAHRHLHMRRVQNIDDRSEEEFTLSDVEVNDRDGIDGSGAQGDGRIPKRARTSVKDEPLMAARAQGELVHGSNGNSRGDRPPGPQDDLDDLYRFSDDPGLDDFDPGVVSPSTREQGPINTQATLVPTQPMRLAGISNVTAPLTSTPSAEPRMAARNRKRSAAAKSGATGRTAFVPLPPKDTQATVVATQSGAPRPSEPQKEARDASKVASSNILPSQITAVGRALVSAFSAKNQEQEVRRTAEHANRSSTAVSGRQIQRGGGGDAPYRNTRARSQSVEPPVLPPPTVPASRRDRRRAPMPVVEEQAGEDAGHQSVIDGMRNEQQSIDLVEQVLDEEEEEEEEDASGSEAALESFIKQKAADIKELLESNHPPQTSSSFNQGEMSSLQARYKATARRQGSSESDFPVESTRAKEARRRRELMERGEPYSPVPGSRAERAKEAQGRARTGRHERLRQKGQQSVAR